VRIHVLLEQLAPSPAPPAWSASASTVGLLLAAVISGAVLAAIITALINIVLARRKSREEERARLRQAFAEALRAQASYKEFAYAIRRRSSEKPAEERARLTDALREIQGPAELLPGMDSSRVPGRRPSLRGAHREDEAGRGYRHEGRVGSQPYQLRRRDEHSTHRGRSGAVEPGRGRLHAGGDPTPRSPRPVVGSLTDC